MASQPPISSRPRSLTRVPLGNTRRRSEAVAVICGDHAMSMRRRMRTVTPVLPTEIGARDGLCVLAVGSSGVQARPRRGRDPPRRRLVQGEPPRLRPRGAGGRAGARWRSTSVGTARARADGRPGARGRRRDGRAAAIEHRPRRHRSRSAARAWAAISRSWRLRSQVRARWSRSARRAPRGFGAGSRPAASGSKPTRPRSSASSRRTSSTRRSSR